LSRSTCKIGRSSAGGLPGQRPGYISVPKTEVAGSHGPHNAAGEYKHPPRPPCWSKCTHRGVIHLNRVWSLAKGFKQHALDFVLNFREKRRSSSSTQRFKQTSHVDTFPAAAPSQDEFELRAAGQQNRLHSPRKLRTISCIALRRTFGAIAKLGSELLEKVHSQARARTSQVASSATLASELPSTARMMLVDARAMKRSVVALRKGALWRSSRAWCLSSPRRDIYALETNSASALDDAASCHHTGERSRPSVKRCLTRQRMASDVAALSPANCVMPSMPGTAPCRTTGRMNDYTFPRGRRGQVALAATR
jgi:hypothetical protein